MSPSPTVPLGRREDERLEFKDRTVLDEPRKVAREVVAMLNARGGEVWIGLGEEERRAVRVQPISGIAAAVASLRDTLTDVIEPAPAGDEVAIETVPIEGTEVLRIVVAQGRRGPYALLDRDRAYLVRFADRMRPMTREELSEAFRRADLETEPVEPPPDEMGARRDELQRSGTSCLWIRAQPYEDIELDLSSASSQELLRDPAASGNDLDGWTVFEPYHRPQPVQGGTRLNDGHGKVRLILRSGTIDFTLPIHRLRHGKGHELWPPKLLQYPISLFRLASRLWQPSLSQAARISAEMALFGVRGWGLRPQSALGLRTAEPTTWTESADLVFERPLTFSFSEVRDEPDRCGARLVERIYEAFGYARREMPHTFDWDSGHLEIPDA